MKPASLVSLVAIPVLASGLQITNPVPGIQWNSTGSRSVSWTNGPSDPAGFAMYFLNYNSTPPLLILISSSITTSDDSYTFDTALPAGPCQLEFTAATNVTDILCESGQFSVVVGGPQGCATCTGVATSTSAGSASPATATATETTSAPSISSEGNSPFAPRGFAIAVGAIVTGFAAMFFMA